MKTHLKPLFGDRDICCPSLYLLLWVLSPQLMEKAETVRAMMVNAMCRLDLPWATQVCDCTSLHVEGCSLEQTHTYIIRKEEREEGKEEGKESKTKKAL